MLFKVQDQFSSCLSNNTSSKYTYWTIFPGLKSKLSLTICKSSLSDLLDVPYEKTLMLNGCAMPIEYEILDLKKNFPFSKPVLVKMPSRSSPVPTRVCTNPPLPATWLPILQHTQHYDPLWKSPFQRKHHPHVRPIHHRYRRLSCGL